MLFHKVFYDATVATICNLKLSDLIDFLLIKNQSHIIDHNVLLLTCVL